MKSVKLGDVLGENKCWVEEESMLDDPVCLDLGLFAPMVNDRKLGRLIRSKDTASSDSAIERIVAIALGKLIAVNGLVKTAVTADDIMRVYMGGPESCMDSGVEMGNVHPCMAYAYPLDRTEVLMDSGNTLAVAYVGDIDSAKYRAVVCTKELLYARCYGPNAALSVALSELGYSYQSSGKFMKGQRLSKVFTRYDELLFPYVDGDYGYGDDFGGYILLGSSGSYEPRSNGLAVPSEICDECGEATDSDDLTGVGYDDERVCADCLDEYYIFARTGERSEEYVSRDDVVVVGCEYYWLGSQLVACCDWCSEYFLLSEGPQCDCSEEEEEEEEEEGGSDD